MALRHKWLAFANEFLKDFNQTQAAIRAGYAPGSAHVTASRLLKNAKVSEYIQERIRERMMSADEAMMRLSAIARGNLADFAGLTAGELKQHPQAQLLHKVKQRRRTIPVKDGEPIIEEVNEVELYDAEAALVHILKEQHLRAGEPTERMDVNDTQAQEARDKLERALARLAERSRPDGGAGQPDG